MILLEQIKCWLKEISKKLQLQHHVWEPPLTWAVGCTVPEHPRARLLAPSTGKHHWSFKKAKWIIAWCTESLFSLKTHLNYHAKHAKCYRAAPAYECRQVRILPKIPLGSASSQKEEYQPLSRQSHCLRYLVLATVCGIRNCHRRLSAHKHTHSACGWSELKSITHFTQEKKSSYSKMTFTVQLLSRHAQNTHITPQLKTLSLLLCNCWFGFFFPCLKVNSDDNRISHCRAP